MTNLDTLRKLHTGPTDRDRLIAALERVFGTEWYQLTSADRGLIVRDCTDDGGVSDISQYRRNIGTGNLESYARVMRVRFSGARRVTR